MWTRKHFTMGGVPETSSAVVCRSPLQALTQGLGEAEVHVEA